MYIISLISVLIMSLNASANPPILYSELRTYVDALPVPNVSIERRENLDAMAQWIALQLRENGRIDLNFICTHNSRRSHLAQIWMAAMMVYYQIDGVQTWSGGTEATAFNLRAVKALERAGFKVVYASGDNPRYGIRFSPDGDGLTVWSKTYNDPANPSSEFTAVMVCSDADEKCPVVFGAAVRFALPFLDPKISDNKPDEVNTYDLRSRQIASEMKYIAAKVSDSLQ